MKHQMTSAWGDSIQWMTPPTSMVGWKTPLPEKDDIVLAPMTSGKLGQYKITQMHPCRDPRDMFFADVEFIGYFDEKNLD